MRNLLLAVAGGLALGACADLPSQHITGPTPFDEEFALTDPNTLRGPKDLPEEYAAAVRYPTVYDIMETQTPVKSQGKRGVCSMFATTAQVENLYVMAGMVEPDFSEQFMQWSVKNEYGAFRNSDGSNGGSNLASVVRYGTIEESAWPYEPAPWTELNDPACTGDSRPTRCYTNGEPPAAAMAANRFKVPASRWMSTSSIKGHLTTKRSGVVVGFDFFYQSWNHRKSTLPISTDYWQQGYVLYPNDKDKEVSYEEPAGHAVLIVGWDDDLAVPMRDENGNTLLDATGQPQMERGFWLIKNSWGTAGFGIRHSSGRAGYGWLSYRYVRDYGSATVGEKPALPLPPETCDDSDGVDEDRDGRANCTDTDCANHPNCGPNSANYQYWGVPENDAIPDADPRGVSAVIEPTERGTIVRLEVDLDVTHTYRGDLRVTLSNGTKTVVLHDRSGGSQDNLKQTFAVTDFAGEVLAGTWTVNVSDNAAVDVGKFLSWSLRVQTR